MQKLGFTARIGWVQSQVSEVTLCLPVA